jgi:hypothetical protein
VPVGGTKAPVEPLASIIPEVAVKAKLPVVSPVTTIEVVVVLPADMVLIVSPK